MLVSSMILFSAPFCVLFAFFYPIDRSVDIALGRQAPSWIHPLGTDSMGRDLLARLLDATVETVIPLWLGVILASLVGVAIGLILMAFEGKSRLALVVSEFAGSFCIFFTSAPITLLVFLWSVFYQSAGLLPVLQALFLLIIMKNFLWLKLQYSVSKNKQYWLAHYSFGGSLMKRLVTYGLLGSWRVSFVSTLIFHLQMVVVIEAALSYLGFGVQEPEASFGNILASHFNFALRSDWSVLITVTVFFGFCYYWPVAFKHKVSCRIQGIKSRD